MRMGSAGALTMAAAGVILSLPASAGDQRSLERETIRAVRQTWKAQRNPAYGKPARKGDVIAPQKAQVLDMNLDGRVSFQDAFALLGGDVPQQKVAFLLGRSAEPRHGAADAAEAPNVSDRVSVRNHGVSVRRVWQF
jgi:hypothetical protein